MIFRKSVCAAMIVSQLGLFAPAFAASTTDAPLVSPEATLIQSVMALQGAGLPKDLLQAQYSGAIAAYTATAPAENRDQRMETALIDMKIVTAQQMTALSEQVNADLSAQSNASLSAASQAELQNLLMAPPAGAQYSFCQTATLVFAGTWVGAMSLAIAGKIDNDNQAMYKTAITFIIIGFATGLVAYTGSC
jgi:hypothetical protein